MCLSVVSAFIFIFEHLKSVIQTNIIFSIKKNVQLKNSAITKGETVLFTIIYCMYICLNSI